MSTSNVNLLAERFEMIAKAAAAEQQVAALQRQLVPIIALAKSSARLDRNRDDRREAWFALATSAGELLDTAKAHIETLNKAAKLSERKPRAPRAKADGSVPIATAAEKPFAEEIRDGLNAANDSVPITQALCEGTQAAINNEHA